MKLPIPFLGGDKQKQEYYLALLLTDEKVGAVILEEQDGKIKILSTREEHFSESLETIPLDDLAQVIDKAITRAEEVLPPDIETHKTVFGLKTNWVEDETKKIKREYLGKLKKVCDALDLTPIGFMVLTEALSYLMQQEEGAPLSAVLVELEKGHMTVTLLRGGKVVETKDGPLTDSAPETLDKLLRHFTVPVLPARIIVIASRADEKLSHAFMSYQWSKSLPFLHVPQTSVLPAGVDAKAVAFGAATQMGFELVGLNQHMPLHDITLPEQLDEDEQHEEEQLEEPEEDSEEVRDAPPPAAPLGASAFGFVMDSDIEKVQPPQEEEETESPHKTTPHPHEENYWEESKKDDAAEERQQVKYDELEEVGDNEEEDETEEKPSFSERMSALTAGFSKLKLPKVTIPGVALSEKQKTVPLFIGLILLLVLFVGLTIFYLYKVQATVVLSVTPKQVEQSQKVTFSTASSDDFSDNIIGAKSVSVSLDGTKTGTPTGKKQTGEKAKGTVTIYNSSDHAQSLDSGTTVTSSNNLGFTLDKAVTVASASGDIFSGTKPGTVDVNVTAKDIGSEYNIPSGTKFSVVSGLAAKNDKAFSGGSKKDITVVSKDDLTKLKKALQDDLTDNAKEQLLQKSSGKTSVLPVMLSSNFDNAKFDKEAGDEASSIKLNGSITFTGASYNTDTINNFGKILIKDRYAQDVSIASNSIKTSITDVKQKDEKNIEGAVKVQAGLLPKIDTDKVVQQLENKSVKQAKETLSSLPQVASSEIKFSPNIPLLPLLFPQMPKHVTVVLKATE